MIEDEVFLELGDDPPGLFVCCKAASPAVSALSAYGVPETVHLDHVFKSQTEQKYPYLFLAV